MICRPRFLQRPTMPTQRFSWSVSRSIVKKFSMTLMFGLLLTLAISVSAMARPVSSPWAWMMRAWEWPPSRVVSISPFTRSKPAPQSCNCRTSSGPWRTTCSTVSGSHSPQPVRSVSAMCDSNESSGRSTEAMPPWAFQVLLSSRLALQTTMTLRWSAASSAARRPAMPAPTITQSAKSWLVEIESILTRYRRGSPNRIRSAGIGPCCFLFTHTATTALHE